MRVDMRLAKAALALLLAAAALYVLPGAVAEDPTGWVEYPSNPVYDPDPGRAYYPCVIYDADRFSGHGAQYYYKMWYGDTDAAVWEWVAFSNDGINWENPQALSGIAAHGYHGKLVYVPGGYSGTGGTYYYKIWYWDPDVSIYGITALRTADSTDGVTWANDQAVTQDATYQLVTGVWPDWNRGTYGPVHVLHNPSATNTGGDPFDYSFTMYYDGTTGGVEVVGLGYSADGNHWTRYGSGPVLGLGASGEWDSNYVGSGTVIREAPGTWRFWYSGGQSQLGDGIGYATSADGINWTKDADNPVFHKTDGVAWRDNRTYTPSVLYSPTLFDGHGDPCSYKMWITGRSTAGNYAVGYIRSPLIRIVTASVASGQGNVVPASQQVTHGSPASVTITPDPGWHISSVTDNGSPVTITDPSGMTYQIASVTEDHQVLASFSQLQPHLTLAKVSDPPGEVVRGQVLTYTLTAANDGEAPATGCLLTDAVPTYADYVSHSTTLNGELIPDVAGTTPLASGLTVNSPGQPPGVIAPGAQAVVTFRVQVGQDLPLGASVRNIAVLTAPGQEPLEASAVNPSAAQLPSTWYFAEGSTQPGFDQWILLSNMGDDPMQVTITYITESGQEQQFNHLLPAHTRRSVLSNAEMPNQPGLAAIVQGAEGLICERALYFDNGGIPGGHQAIGINAPSDRLFFAEGFTGTEGSPFDTWILVLNPNAEEAHLHVTYMFPGGSTEEKDYAVPGRRRLTVSVDAEVGQGREVSATLVSDLPVVAERAMYFTYQDLWAGGHVGRAATGAREDWYLAEGYTGWEGSLFDTYILVSNDNPDPNPVTVTFYFPDGSTRDFPFEAPPTGRLTVNADALLGEGQMISTRVRAQAPVVVERAMYFDYRRELAGGHNALGSASPSSSLYFAEGYTGNPASRFETWLLVQNTSDQPKTALVDFILASGQTVQKEVPLPASSRTTLYCNEILGAEALEFGMRVRSQDGSACLLAERAMYFDYLGSFGHAAGGDDVPGY